MTASAFNLTIGNPYRFYVIAENSIGTSIASTITRIYSCVNPTGIPRPLQGSVT